MSAAKMKGQNFHVVAAFQFLPDGNAAAVDASANAVVSDIGVDVVGKVEHR